LWSAVSATLFVGVCGCTATHTAVRVDADVSYQTFLLTLGDDANHTEDYGAATNYYAMVLLSSEPTPEDTFEALVGLSRAYMGMKIYAAALRCLKEAEAIRADDVVGELAGECAMHLEDARAADPDL